MRKCRCRHGRQWVQSPCRSEEHGIGVVPKKQIVQIEWLGRNFHLWAWVIGFRHWLAGALSPFPIHGGAIMSQRWPEVRGLQGQ